jgi:hypothetical protein
MSQVDRGEPKLIFPGLAGFYATVSDLWYPLIRVTAGPSCSSTAGIR